MSDVRSLGPEVEERLLQLVTSCAATAQSAMRQRAEVSCELANPRLFRLDLNESDLLERTQHSFVTLEAAGDAVGRLLLVCPSTVAVSLALLALKPAPDVVEARRGSDELADDEKDAFAEMVGLIGSGLEAAVREASLHTLRFQPIGVGKVEELNIDDVLDDDDLIQIVYDCLPEGHDPGEIHLFVTGRFTRDGLGLELESAGGDEEDALEGEERGQLSMIGIALGSAERNVMNRLADSHSLDLVMTDDIREVLFMLVNTPCAGVVIGDRSQSPNVRTVESNLATLKRFRSHPRGGQMPVFYLMRWPDKDHVLSVAQLGANDIVGIPARPSLLEKRLNAFVRRTLHQPTRQTP